MSEYNCNGPHGLHPYPAPLLHPPPLGHEPPNQNIAHNLLPSQGHLPVVNINNPNLGSHNTHINGSATVSSNTAQGTITDRCRFCGEELPYDAFTIMAHFNNHFRPGNNSDVLNPCSYDTTTTVDSRLPVNNNPLYMHNQSAEALNNHSNLSHMISHSHLNGNATDISAQGLNNFPYTYSPQTEPSNLSVPTNNMKCSDNNSPNNLRLNSTVCMDNEHSESSSIHGGMSNNGGNSQEEVPSNLNSVKNSPPHQQQNLGCSNTTLMGVVPSPGHMDSPLSLASNNAGNRCSPLNLTGRPKLDTSSPVAPNLASSGPHMAPQLPVHAQPCAMPLINASLHHHDLQQHHGQAPSSVSVPSLLNNGNNHATNATFLNNYTVPNGYFGSSCLYNSGNNGHHIQAPQLPSCRLQQNFSHSLDNVGLSIPVLSPNQEDVQQSSATLNIQHGSPQGTSTEAPRQQTSGHPLHVALTDQQCGIQLPMCNGVEGGVPLLQNGSQTECSVAMNLSDNNITKRIFNKTSDMLYQCFACRQSFSNVLVYQNHLMCHFNNVRPDSCKGNNSNTNNSFVKSSIENVQGYSISARSSPSVQPSAGQSLTVGGVTTSSITTASLLSSGHTTNVVPSSHVIAPSTSCNPGSMMTSCNGSSPLVSTTPSPSGHISPMPSATAKPYKCSICNREFSDKEPLREHFKEHEAAKPFHCDTCGLGVSNLRALKRHKLTHTGLKPYKCDTCGKCFLQKTDLARHMNVHERPKYLTCEHCKRTFTAVSSFKNHKCKGVKEVMPYLCHICGDGCSNRLAWSYHMWKHTKNPMFVPFQENLLPVGNA